MALSEPAAVAELQSAEERGAEEEEVEAKKELIALEVESLALTEVSRGPNPQSSGGGNRVCGGCGEASDSARARGRISGAHKNVHEDLPLNPEPIPQPPSPLHTEIWASKPTNCGYQI